MYVVHSSNRDTLGPGFGSWTFNIPCTSLYNVDRGRDAEFRDDSDAGDESSYRVRPRQGQ